MTPQLNEQSANIDELLSLVKELVSITDRLIDETGNDQFDAVTRLTGEREEKVELLGRVHRTVAASEPAPMPLEAVGAERMVKELQTALTLLGERSAVLNKTILEKSESLVSTIHAVQQNRFYGTK